jgi:phenylalanyl-tRNA synthetase alpha chain
MAMEEKLRHIKNAALPMILNASSLEELEEIKLQVFGRNGSLTLAMKDIAHVSKGEKPRMGQLINETKKILDNAISEKFSILSASRLTQSAKEKNILDVSEPGIKPELGHLHLITQAIEEITTIFQRIGFTRVRYPEVEWDWFAFEALNFPENHPARDDWETFFMKEAAHPKHGPMLLTPHTSSGQVREMKRHVDQLSGLGFQLSENSSSVISQSVKKTGQQKTGKPNSENRIQRPDNRELNIKMLNIAKCYRRQSDVSHTPMFHQFEGLVVGKDIAITHLKGTLDYFVKSYFGEQRRARIRPYHFQFTEPSFEVDVSCGVCNGTGKIAGGEKCRLCKAGWLEMGGAGMVHPNVLKAGGIDSESYTGFAFGWGVERVLMMKEGIEIDDLRLLYSNKLEFLEQF